MRWSEIFRHDFFFMGIEVFDARFGRILRADYGHVGARAGFAPCLGNEFSGRRGTSNQLIKTLVALGLGGFLKIAGHEPLVPARANSGTNKIALMFSFIPASVKRICESGLTLVSEIGRALRTTCSATSRLPFIEQHILIDEKFLQPFAAIALKYRRGQ